MNTRAALFQVADRQQGFFTAQQAVDCGIARSAFHFRLESGEWLKEGRGLYRLANYPVMDRPELVRWSLWSRNKKGEPQGVWSHETALEIYDIGDFMPSKMYMTVPRSFRRDRKVPRVLRLQRADLDETEIDTRRGYRVVRPLRSLIDLLDSGRADDDMIASALREAFAMGVIRRDEVNEAPESAGIHRLREIMREYEV